MQYVSNRIVYYFSKNFNQLPSYLPKVLARYPKVTSPAAPTPYTKFYCNIKCDIKITIVIKCDLIT